MHKYFALALLLTTACDDEHPGEAEPFDSLMDCVDEHVNGGEGFTPDKAITICCLEHPLGGATPNTVCTETQAGCETYVDAQLDDALATTAQVTAGCTDYLFQRTQ